MADEKKGVPIAEPTLLEQTQKTVENLKTENDRRDDILKREEAFESRRLLGGGTNAGQAPPQITEEQKKKQEAVKFFEGTQIAKSIEKYG